MSPPLLRTEAVQAVRRDKSGKTSQPMGNAFSCHPGRVYSGIPYLYQVDTVWRSLCSRSKLKSQLKRRTAAGVGDACSYSHSMDDLP